MPTVKTAISIQKHLFDEVNKVSKRLGIPRSRFFSKAVEEFIRREQAERLVEQINRSYATDNSEEKQVRSAAAGSFRRLVEGTW